MTAPLMPEARVNGHVIPAEEIAAEAQLHPAPAGKPGVAWRRAAQALAVRRLLLEEAARAGVNATPEPLAAGRRETPEEAQIRAILDRLVTPAPVSEGEARAFWHHRRAELGDTPFAEARPAILAALERRNWTADARALTARLLANARLEGIDSGPIAG